MSTSPMYFEQPIVIFDTTEALNLTTGSFVLYGGVSIEATYESTTTSTGAFVVGGGVAIQKNLNVGGIQHITNTTESSGTGSGALVVAGGVGIAKDLNVGGDATITGNLYVNGTTTYVNTITMDVTDNTLMLNAGPSGAGDAGVLLRRDGVDATSNVETAVTSGTATSISSSQIVLPAGMDQSDNYYRGWWIKTADGYAQVTSYTASNLTAALSTTGNTLPTSGSLSANFDLYNKSYVAEYYAETADEFRFAYIADSHDPNYSLENFGNYLKVRMDTLYANTAVSTANLTVTTSATIANLALSTANLQAATIGGLRVTGETILHGTVTSGALAVTGESFLRGAVTAGALNVTGDSILQGFVTAGALAVTGESFLRGAVTAGALNVTGNSILQGLVTAGALAVTGESFLRGAVTAGALNVTGDSILQGFVTAGALAVTGESFLRGWQLLVNLSFVAL
ncbi:hypothetical protein EBU95_12610 [bacterium]|nr:hypothetical protein [bacterium]